MRADEGQLCERAAMTGSGQGRRRRLGMALSTLVVILAIGAIAPSLEAAPSAQQEPPRTGGAYWYSRYGCVACHGGQGEGTLIGPQIARRPDSPLAAERIIAQVRRPAALMPDFPDDVLSDERLTAIIERIWSFEDAR